MENEKINDCVIVNFTKLQGLSYFCGTVEFDKWTDDKTLATKMNKELAINTLKILGIPAPIVQRRYVWNFETMHIEYEFGKIEKKKRKLDNDN